MQIKRKTTARRVSIIALAALVAGTVAVKFHTDDGVIGVSTVQAVAKAAEKPEETITLASGRDVNHIYPRLISEFMKKNPDIRVNYSELPFSTDDQHNILATKFSAGDDGYDVVSLDQAWAAEFAEAGWLEPLNRYFPVEQQKAFFDWAIRAVSYKGNVYAVPKVADAGMLFYRRDLVKTPPKTWEELIALCKRNIGRNGIHAGLLFQGNQYEGLVCNAVEFIGSCGGSILTNGKPTLNSPGGIQGLSLMRRLVKDGIAPYEVITAQENDSTTRFQQGDALFMRNWPSSWMQLNAAGSRVRGKVGIARLPAGKQGGSGVSCLGGWNLGISKYSRHRLAAWRLIQYLTNMDAQKFSALKGSILPTCKKLYQDTDILKSNPYWSHFEDILEHAVPRPISPLYTSLSNPLQSNIHKMITGELTARQAAVRIDKNLSILLQKN